MNFKSYIVHVNNIDKKGTMFRVLYVGLRPYLKINPFQVDCPDEFILWPHFFFFFFFF